MRTLCLTATEARKPKTCAGQLGCVLHRYKFGTIRQQYCVAISSSGLLRTEFQRCDVSRHYERGIRGHMRLEIFVQATRKIFSGFKALAVFGECERCTSYSSNNRY